MQWRVFLTSAADGKLLLKGCLYGFHSIEHSVMLWVALSKIFKNCSSIMPGMM